MLCKRGQQALCAAVGGSDILAVYDRNCLDTVVILRTGCRTGVGVARPGGAVPILEVLSVCGAIYIVLRCAADCAPVELSLTVYTVNFQSRYCRLAQYVLCEAVIGSILLAVNNLDRLDLVLVCRADLGRIIGVAGLGRAVKILELLAVGRAVYPIFRCARNCFPAQLRLAV